MKQWDCKEIIAYISTIHKQLIALPRPFVLITQSSFLGDSNYPFLMAVIVTPQNTDAIWWLIATVK